MEHSTILIEDVSMCLSLTSMAFVLLKIRRNSMITEILSDIAVEVAMDIATNVHQTKYTHICR